LKEVAFIIKTDNPGTSRMRGQQVSAALGADLLRWRELTVAKARGYRVLVYVKKLPTPTLMRQIKDAGVLQVVDPLDNYHWMQLRRRAPFTDHFIAANQTHRLELTRRFGVRATMIPHHHCNTDELRIPSGREPPTLGYIGSLGNWPASRRVTRGLPYPVFSSIIPPGPLIESFLRIDIGLAYRMDRQKLSYNAATKLTNFMSFGIPSVLPPEHGYLEVSRHYEACVYARSVTEFRLLVQELAGDRALRRRMGDAGYEAARPFHLKAIALQYRAFLESL
jgi:hypothetical protein